MLSHPEIELCSLRVHRLHEKCPARENKYCASIGRNASSASMPAAIRSKRGFANSCSPGGHLKSQMLPKLSELLDASPRDIGTVVRTLPSLFSEVPLPPPEAVPLPAKGSFCLLSVPNSGFKVQTSANSFHACVSLPATRPVARRLCPRRPQAWPGPDHRSSKLFE